MVDVMTTAMLLGGLLYLEFLQQRQLQIKTKS